MFPIIKNISDILPSIESRKEFLVMDKGEYIVIDYAYVDNDSFNDPFRLECRGLIFDAKTGVILRRPLEKFMNYGEKDTYDTIDWSKNHIVMDKRDGSMIAPFILNGKVVLGTRAGITEHSQKAEALIDSRTREEIRLAIGYGFTPIFEYTGPENRIVLPYEKSELRLLAMREIVTGEYVSMDKLHGWSLVFGISLVDVFETKLDKDSIFSFRETATGVEGFVVFFPELNLHIKIKSDDYTKMHRAVSFLDRENMILPVVLDNLYDDILPALSEENQRRVRDYASAVHEELNSILDGLNILLDQIVRMNSRKEQAIWIQANANKSYWPVLFHGLDGKNVLDSLKHVVLKDPALLSVRWI